MKRYLGKKGFTLVEIIVVLVILAILSALLIPSMVGWIDDAQAKACMTELSGICRSYQAEAAQYAYVVNDPAPLLAAAAEDWDGDYTGGTTFTCPCGNWGTFSYASDNAAIASILCTKHGGRAESLDGAISYAWTLPWTTNLAYKSIHEYFYQRGGGGQKPAGSSLDSTGSNYAPLASQELRKLGVDTDTMDWRIYKTTNNGNLNTYEVYWTDGKISMADVAAGTVFNCTKVTLTIDKNGSTTNVGALEKGTVTVERKAGDGQDIPVIDNDSFTPTP